MFFVLNRVAAAESLPVEDNSADLITVAVALHWFDHSGFYKEVCHIRARRIEP